MNVQRLSMLSLMRTIRTVGGFWRMRLTECPLCGPASRQHRTIGHFR
jgi:hypothetical protein